MTKSLDALIRLARFKVEELQKQMAGLDEARAVLERQIDNLSQSVPEDDVSPEKHKDGFVAYGSYAQAVIQRKQNLRASIEDVDEQADRLRQELEGAFQELKKFELMDERARAKEKAARDARAQAELDDIAATRCA